DLCAAERSVVEQSAVFARKRHALRDTLVDDVNADFCQAMDIGFPRAKITPLDRVVKEAVDRVAIIAIVLRRVHTSLCRDRMCAARTVLKTEALDVIAKLT